MLTINTVIIPFAISCMASYLIIKVSKRFNIGMDDRLGIQKINNVDAPRLGGIALVISTFVSSLIIYKLYSQPGYSFYLIYFASLLPVFGGGLFEDIYQKSSLEIRFILTLISAVLAYYLVDIKIRNIGLDLIDSWLQVELISLVLTVIAIGAICHGTNMIDGFNGLLLGFSTITFSGICFVSWMVEDHFMIYFSLILLAAHLGVLIFNYPYSKLFIGDAGSYSIGFFLATSIILLQLRNKLSISPVAIGIFLSYPALETVFSICRRGLKKMVVADNKHLHHLIFYILNKLFHQNSSTTNNFLVALILLPLFTAPVFAGIIFLQNGLYSILSFFVFLAIYLTSYFYLKKKLAAK